MYTHIVRVWVPLLTPKIEEKLSRFNALRKQDVGPGAENQTLQRQAWPGSGA